MTFEKEKSEFLSRSDKSKKGSIDSKIKNLVNKINSSKNFYTTSSCAGRIVLYTPHSTGKKNVFLWHLVDHSKTSFLKIKRCLYGLDQTEVWLAAEPVILHVAAKDIKGAKLFMNRARDLGFKRGGIISERKNKVLIELVSTENLNTILKKDKILVDDIYLKIIVDEANSKLEKTWDKIKKLEKEIKIIFQAV